MDNSLHQDKTSIQKPGVHLINPQLFGNILCWLVSLVRLTEEEQKKAGVYFGSQR